MSKPRYSWWGYVKAIIRRYAPDREQELHGVSWLENNAVRKAVSETKSMQDGEERLKFIRHARQLGFSLESIRELLSIRIDPEHHTCQESKGIVQERLQEVEARIAELQSMQRSLQRLNDACCGTAHSSVYCSILEALEQGASGVKSGC